MKTVKCLMVGAFALLLLVPLATFRREPGIVSEIDNRMLQEFPFSPEELAKGGDMTAKVESYVSDRIGFRDQMILGFTQFNDKFFGKMVHPSYCWGKEGYIYFVPSIRTANEAYYTAFADMVRAMQDYCEDRSVPFLFVFEPMKEVVLPEYVPVGENYDHWGAERLFSLLEERGVRYLDMTGLLRKLTEAGETVFDQKNDAGHWNELGAYYVTNAVLEELKTDFPGLRPLRLEDLEISETLQESLSVSRFEIHEWVPFITLPDRQQTIIITEEMRSELELDPSYQEVGGWQDPERLAQGAPRTLMFQGSHMNASGRKFLRNALGEYDYIHNYQNVINFDYYFNIFQPECVVFEVAEFVLRFNSYFDQKNMSAFRLNPTLDSVLSRAGEPEPLKGVSVQKGQALTKLLWTGGPDWIPEEREAPYVWAVLNGTPYDMRRSAGGGWEVTMKNEDWDRSGGAVGIAVLDGETVTLLGEWPEEAASGLKVSLQETWN